MKNKIIISILISSVLSFPIFANASQTQTENNTQNIKTISPSPKKDVPIDQESQVKVNKQEQEEPWVGNEKTEDYSTLISDIKNKNIKEIDLSNTLAESLTARVTLKSSIRYTTMLPSRDILLYQIQNQVNSGDIKLSVVPHFEQLIEVKSIEEPKESIWSIVAYYTFNILKLIFLVAILGFVLILVQKYGMNIFSKTDHKKIKAKDLKVSFEDIQGIDEAKSDVKEIIDFMNNEKIYNKLGANVPHGIILSGEPGTGKTMLAKAVAKELKGDFYQASGSEFVELFVGLGAGRIRSLFKKARKSKKAVIFIDEIDAIGKKRGGSELNSEAEQTLNQLLVELDGFNTLSKKRKGHVLVIAATNRKEILDEALLRPGRFDRDIKVNNPNKEGRKQILKVYLKKYAEKNNKTIEEVEKEINIDRLAKMTEGFSGAELSNLVNEALIKAGKRYSDAISKNINTEDYLTEEDILKSRDKLLLGDPRKDLELLEVEKKTTAYHETGHAILALAKTKDPVEKVTIVPHSWALGLMLQIKEREEVSLTKEDLMSKLSVMMAGRAAEEIFMDRITTGASNDMERAAQIAMLMITRWGFGETLGLTSIPDLRVLSDITRSKIEQEAKELVSRAYETAKLTLLKYKNSVEEMSSTLLQKETLNKAEIYELWERTSIQEDKEKVEEEEVLVEGRIDDRMEEVLKIINGKNKK